MIKEWNGRDWPNECADFWKCSRCGRVYGGATTGKPPFKCLCPDDGVVTVAVQSALASASASPHPELLQRVQNYLGNGGLFNPEAMAHDKVRELIRDLASVCGHGWHIGGGGLIADDVLADLQSCVQNIECDCIDPPDDEHHEDYERHSQSCRIYLFGYIGKLRAALPASASPGSGEGRLFSLKRAALMLIKSLPDELVEALRAEWGNTNLAVLKYWRDELTAELSALPASEGQEPPAQKDQR